MLDLSAVEVAPPTKIKSMIATIRVLSSSTLASHQEQGLTIPNGVGVTRLFRQFFLKIAAEKALCETQLATTLANLYEDYFRLVYTQSGSSDFEVAVEIKRLQSLIYESINEQGDHRKCLLLASNAISSLILSFTRTSVERHGIESGNRAMNAVVERMGMYASSSLAKYLRGNDEGAMDFLSKVVAWTFVNGNPEMKVRAWKESEQELVFEQFGECRQWRNSNIVGCSEHIVWPINYGFFQSAAREIDPRFKVTLDKKQCHGASVCEFRFKLSDEQSQSACE